MSYAQFSTIEATDYNTLVGGDPTATANTLNVTWATGSGSAGYGQTAEANVSVGDTITASKWANLVNKTANAASHQNSSITSVTAPASGNTITFISAIPTNLQTIYTNRLNAVSQSSTTSNTVTRGTTWSSLVTFTHTATFANGDAARYFFNSGGQLAITVSHANNTSGINLLLNTLCTQIGTVVLSAPSSGTANIAGTLYNGVTRVGGSGSTPTVSTNSGYYAWTSSNANVFTQTTTTGPSSYLGTFIRVIVKTNGTVGSRGDTGNVVTIYTVWDEIPDGLTAGTGSTTTLTVRPPETGNISNTWGAITLTGSQTGS